MPGRPPIESESALTPPTHQDSAVPPNSVSASDLPPELLANIFLHHVALYDRCPRPYAWIRLSFVCKYWRDLCLNLPDLWTRIVVIRLACVREMLERSGSQPLVVRVGTFENDYYRRMITLGLVIREMSRIRELELRGPKHRHLKFVKFPPKVIPVYDRLAVRGYQFEWTDEFFAPSVRHLVIQGGLDSSRHPSTVSAMLETLGKMSLLETIILDNAIPMASSQWEVGSWTVDLPRLRSLIVTDNGHTCAALLDRLSFPSSAKIALNCTSCRDSELVHVATALASKFSCQTTIESARPLLSFSVTEVASPSSLHMRGWKSEKQIDVGGVFSESEPADLEIVLRDMTVGMFSMDTAFHLLLPAAQSLSLDVGVIERCLEGDRRQRGWAPGIKMLRLSGWTPDSFQELLPYGPESDSMKPGWVWPHLHTLVLDEPQRKSPETSMEWDIKTSMALCDVLSRRCEVIGKLHTLVARPRAVRPVRWMLEKYVSNME